jgi:hypothetical protein
MTNAHWNELPAFVKPIAKLLEAAAVPLGLHVALTGGTLYKEGIRKDVDWLVYGHEHSDNLKDLQVRIRLFFISLKCGYAPNVSNMKHFGRVTKLTWHRHGDSSLEFDFIIPELTGSYSAPRAVSAQDSNGLARGG